MKRTVNPTIDRAGRVVIPSDIREKAQLEPGTPLQVFYREGRIEIEALPREVRLVRRGRLHVAVPGEKSESITEGQVAAVIDAVRQGRG